MWDIMLPTEKAAKSLAGNLLITKSVKLQTKYMGQRKTKVSLDRVPLIISEDYLGFFFFQFGEVVNVSVVKGKSGIATGDIKILVTVDRKYVINIPNVLICGGRPIYVVIEGQ